MNPVNNGLEIGTTGKPELHNSRRAQTLSGTHSQCPIQTNGLAIEGDVFDDVLDQSRILIGAAQSRGKGNLFPERDPCLFWESGS